MILDAFYEYGFTRPLSDAGYFSTDKAKRINNKIKDLALGYGCLVALCGAVGSGKTSFVNQLMKELKAEKKCLVSYSYSSDRKKVNIKTLLTALLTDLNRSGQTISISSSPEIRDRRFVRLMEENDKPVVLFIDEAHDLQGNTLASLKKLIEMAKISQQTLSIIFAGQPKLKNTIQASSLEEIGARAYVIDFDEHGMTQRDQYLKWAITQCISKDRTWDSIITAEALKLLTDHLLTPLQIISHFNRALEMGLEYRLKPIDCKVIELVLKKTLHKPSMSTAPMQASSSLDRAVETRPNRVIEPVQVDD